MMRALVSSLPLVGLLLVLIFTSSGCLRRRMAAAEAEAAAAPKPQPAATAAAAVVAEPTVGPGTVAAGTRMMLHMDQTLDSRQTAPGQKFTATLAAGLPGDDGQIVVPEGTQVFGTIVSAHQSGRIAGHSELDVTFTDVSLGGRLIPIHTEDVVVAGQGTGRKTARQVGTGAMVGAAFGGGQGAKKGAAVGAAAAVLTKGNQVSIPAGTLLDVGLAAPLSIEAPPSAVAAPTAPAAAPPATPAAAPVAPAAGAAPAASASAAPATPADGEQKDCIKKLIGKGFSPDEAIATCGG